MKILIVEDEPVAMDILGAALKGMGHEVFEARNGCEAMDVLRNSNCRFVIADWNMPEMNGVELCRAIRAEELGGYVYILLLTVRSGTSSIVEGLSAGADEFMSKPFETEELSVRIRTGERILSLQTHEVTIFALAKLAESRDPETGAHLERTQRYTRILAEYLADPEAFSGRSDPEFIRLC